MRPAVLLSAAWLGACADAPADPANRAPVPLGIPDMTVAVDQTAAVDLSDHFDDPDGDTLLYTAVTSDAGVATTGVSGSRLSVRGVAKGQATVTVTAHDPDGLSARQDFTVTVPNRSPEAIDSIPRVELVAGDSATLAVSGYFSDPDGDTLAYTAATSDAGVAGTAVSGDTLTVRGTAQGTATVTVTAADPDGLTAEQNIAVSVARPVPTTVVVTPDSASLTALEDTAPFATEVFDQIGRPMPDAVVAWSSGDTTVATTDSAGVATAKGNGTASITTTAEAASGRGWLTVMQVAHEVTVTPATASVTQGDTLRLAAEARDANGYPMPHAVFGWSSGDTAVARVDSAGLVEGMTEGTVTIARRRRGGRIGPVAHDPVLRWRSRRRNCPAARRCRQACGCASMNDPAALAERFSGLVDRKAAVALLRGAIARHSITGDEANFVDFLQDRMRERSLTPERAEFLPGRPNIWGERKGAGEGPRLLFAGHTDTVHVRGWKERWKGSEREDPFRGVIVDGEIWGRGAGDLKAGICASLAALDLLDGAGIKPAGDVAFAFVGDEEGGEPGTGVSAGVRHYTDQIISGGIQRPDFVVYVEPTRLSVFPAQMGFFIADVTVSGKTAYFGMPELGVDALKAMHSILGALWDHSDEISKRAEHPLVGRGFALVTRVSGGGYIAVPGECSFSLIRKLLPGEDMDEAVAELEAVIRAAPVQEGITIDIAWPSGRDLQYGGSPTEVEAGLAPVKALSRALSAAMPGRGRIEGAPYWSESSFFVNRIGCPAVYVAPGDIANCHTLEERVNVEEYIAGIVAFAVFISSFCSLVEPASTEPSQRRA